MNQPTSSRSKFCLTVMLYPIIFGGCCGVCALKSSKIQTAPLSVGMESTDRPVALAGPSCTPTSGSLTQIIPQRAIAGGSDFFIKVEGTGFTASSLVQWAGSNRPTRPISGMELRAHIQKADLLQPGSFPVTVATQDGGMSNILCFEVTSPGLTSIKAVMDTNREVIAKGAGKKRLTDPATVGAIALLLNNALDRLQTLLENATGDAMAVGQSLEANGHAVLADLQGKLNYDIQQLKKEDRYLVNQAHDLAMEINVASNQLLIKATDDAKQSMLNADIIAFNAMQSVPCQAHVGRLRYASTNRDGRLFKFIVGLDDKVHVYGNWLQLTKPTLTVWTDEHTQPLQAKIDDANDTEIVIELPDEIMQSVQKPDTLSISCTPGVCTPKSLGRTSIGPGAKQDVTLDIAPLPTFDLDAVISPTAEVGTDTWDWPQSFYSYGQSCDANYRVDHTWSLPDAVQSQFVISNPWGIVVTTANCGSAIDGVEFNGPASTATSMIVHGYVKGCGTSWFGINCNGHGWLGYNLNLHYLQYARKALDQQEDKQTLGGVPQPYTLQYNLPYPPAYRNVEWHYQVTVLVRHGPADPHPTRVLLSDDVPNDVVNGFYSVFDESNAKLTVTFPPNFRSLSMMTK